MVMTQFFLEVPVEVLRRKEKPSVQLRKFIIDPQLNKAIITACLEGKTITIKPVFKKPHLQVGNLINTGIMSRNKQGELVFSSFYK